MPMSLFSRFSAVSLAAGLVLGAFVLPGQAQTSDLDDISTICAEDAAGCMALLASVPLINLAAIDTALTAAASSNSISDAQLQDILTAFSTRVQQNATLSTDGLERIRAVLVRARAAAVGRNSATLNASFAASVERVNNGRSDSNGLSNEDDDAVDKGNPETEQPASPSTAS